MGSTGHPLSMLAAHCNRALATHSSWTPMAPLPDIHKPTSLTFSKPLSESSRASSEYSDHDRSPTSDHNRSDRELLPDPYRQKSPISDTVDPLQLDTEMRSSPVSPTLKYRNPYDLPIEQKFHPGPQSVETYHRAAFSEHKFHPGPTEDLKLSRVSTSSQEMTLPDSRLPITPPADQHHFLKTGAHQLLITSLWVNCPS